MTDYDGGDETGRPLYNEDHLRLSYKAMDNWTFIEWVERLFESDQQTALRITRMVERHKEWHRTSGGIHGCCVGKIEANKIIAGAIKTSHLIRTQL